MKKITQRLSEGKTDMIHKNDEHAREIDKLRAQIESLEEELRRLYQSRHQFDQANKQNEKLVATLQDAKAQIEALRAEVDKLTAPPSTYAIFSGMNEDGTGNVYVSGRKMKVNVHPSIKGSKLRKGQEVVLNEALNVIEIKGFDSQGEVVRLKDVLEGGRALVMTGDTSATIEVYAANYSSSTLCTNLSACIITIAYYDPATQYYINVTGAQSLMESDLGNMFNVSSIMASVQSKSEMAFTTVTYGTPNIQVDAPIRITNIGNNYINNLSVTGYNLPGQIAPTIVLNVSAFRAGTTLNNSVQLQDGVPVNVPFIVSPGLDSYAEFYLWVTIPADQYPRVGVESEGRVR